MKLIKVLFFVACFVASFSVSADTYPEVVFDNSLVSGSYARSKVEYAGHSWVENVNKHLLVSDTLFFTPGNSLSLKYISSAEGEWRADIGYSRQKLLYRVLGSDFLTFRIYVKNKSTKLEHLPKIMLSQWATTTKTLALNKYITDFKHNAWITVKIPCKDFSGLNNDAAINSVVFLQNKSSQDYHHLFIDQIEFLPKVYSEARLSSPAVLTAVDAYDKMVNLKWQLPLTPSIRYVKIYRSTDGTNYSPVAIKPIHMQSCLDHTPVIGKKYFYKVAWLDYNYNESPFSAVRDVQTKEISNANIMDLIQSAHINYFVENYDVNSGMYMPFRLKDKALVSTKETSGAILALIIGAEKGQISRQGLLNRLHRITNFLLKAQNYNGIFPNHFDGRKGVPEYVFGSQRYDVTATASIVEALMVAKQYFSKDVEDESTLRNKISTLYERIDWEKLTIANDDHVLTKYVSLDEVDRSGRTEFISGPNYALNTYIMATAGVKSKLPITSYRNGVYNTFDSIRYAKMDEFDLDVMSSERVTDPASQKVSVLRHVDSLMKTSILEDTIMFGERLQLGDIQRSLIELYRPFLTIRPQILKDTLFDWTTILSSYVKVIKRRDNELRIGVNHSDIWGFTRLKGETENYRLNPAIAPAAIITDKEMGQGALLALYDKLGKNLFTEYGFRSWLDLQNEDVSDEYVAVNQYTLAVMIENANSGLIWNLYEQIPEFKSVRSKLFSKEVQ